VSNRKSKKRRYTLPPEAASIPNERIRHHGFFGRIDRFRRLSLVFPAQKPIHPRAEGEGENNKNSENQPSALCFGMHEGIIAQIVWVTTCSYPGNNHIRTVPNYGTTLYPLGDTDPSSRRLVVFSRATLCMTSLVKTSVAFAVASPRSGASSPT